MKVEPAGLPPVVAVVIHDVAPPTWDDCRRLAEHLDAIDARLRKTWLVVPRYHGHSLGPRMVDALTRLRAAGDELALHGWRHLDDGAPQGALDRWMRTRYTAGEGEFAGLDGLEAARRIAAGRAWFARHGWPVHGFVPPAWLASEAALAAIESADFGYTCSLGGLRVWKPRRAFDEGPRPALTLASQSVVYSTRSAWRRGVSCLWNAGVAWRQAGQWLLRIELHPADVRHAGVRRSFTRIVERALADRRQPVTLAGAASRLIAWQAMPREQRLALAARPSRVPTRAQAQPSTLPPRAQAQPSTLPITTIAPPVAAPVNAPASTSPG